jgi:CRISPR-associated protein Cst2
LYSYNLDNMPCNRKRLHDEDQLAVEFKDYPDHEKFADDFFMGWLIAATGKDRDNILKEIEKKGRDKNKFSFKRDSILRLNLAVSLKPYRHDSVFTQSPQDKTAKDIKSHTNTDNSQLLHRETSLTAFQYPFALNLEDCREKPEWTKSLLKAIGELNNVAGNHARSYFEMAPASIVIRLTPQLVAGYDTYGFRIQENEKHDLPEIIEGIIKDDYPGSEFYLGGKIVKDLDETTFESLQKKGVHLDRNPQRLLETVGEKAFQKVKVG